MCEWLHDTQAKKRQETAAYNSVEPALLVAGLLECYNSWMGRQQTLTKNIQLRAPASLVCSQCVLTM